MSTNEAARTAPTSRPQQPAPAAQRPTSAYLDPASIYHPARLARALGALLGLLLGAALLTGGLGHPLTINGLVAPLDGMPATSPERTAAELDRDAASSDGPLVPVDADPATSDSPATILLPEDEVAPAPLPPADAAPTVSPASASPLSATDQTDAADQTDAYSTFAQARAVAHPAAAVNLPARSSANRSHDGVRAGRPATFPDGTPLLSRPSHRTGLPSTPREATPAPTPATDLLSPTSPKSTPKSAPLPGIPPLWETSDVPSKA